MTVDILFGQSYFLRFDPKLWAAMQPFPPLGTLYAASFMRSRGYSVALFDAMLAETEDEWAQALDLHQPRCAVLYEDNFNYLSKMCLLRMRQAALKMIAMARQRGCTVVVGGADASDHPEIYLQGGAQYILLGEGEYTLGELLEWLENGKKEGADSSYLTALEGIQGLAWIDGEAADSGRGEVRRTPPRPDISDLDGLPFPAWDLVDIPRYRAVWQERHGYFALNMVTTRGCPFHCNWCAKPIWGQRYHTRSPQNVAAEMEHLRQQYQVDFIWFADDIFGLKPGWAAAFAEARAGAGLQVPFKCLSRVDLLLRPGEIDALHRAGAQIVWVGAESGSQKILDGMEKGTRVEQIYQAAQTLRAANIQVGFFLQFGYPGETRQDIERTLQMVRDCQPDDIGMSVSYPLPGTRFYEAVSAQLGVQQNWYDSQDLAMLYQGPFSTAFYRQLHTTLHREFRARKAWQALRNPGGRRRAGTAGGELSRLSALGRLVHNGLRLPLERWKLERLARQPHQGIGVLQPALQPDEAARPSAQEK